MYKTVADSMATAVALKPLVANANHCRRARRMQSAGEDPRTRGFDLAIHRVELTHDRLEPLAWRRRAFGLVEAEQVLWHFETVNGER